jgi:Ca2+-binding RTX toxin-like protein
VPNSGYVERYGGDIGMSVSDSVAVGARNFAWSWHSESVGGSFENVMAFDSYGFLMARGIGGEMTDSGGAGNERGIILYEYGDEDGRNISIEGVTLRETQQYSVFASKDPLNNTISDSFFESYGPGNLASALAVTVKSTTFVKTALDPNDVLTGTAGADLLLGGKGADVISAGDGNDTIWGGAGEDRLTGGYGRDRFAYHSLAEAGDRITDFHGGVGGDILDLSVLAAKYGWGGGDPFANGYLRFVQAGEDVQVQVDSNGGGDAFTTLVTLENVHASELSTANVGLSLSDAAGPAPATDPETTLRGTEAYDVLRGSIGIDHIIGGGGDDRLFASVGDTLLEGGAGDDVISGNRGDDILKGGTGQDLMSGGDGQDKLYGEAGNDTLLGGDGNDRLYAGDGDDVLDGGAGADVLAGSGGYDIVDYSSSAIGVIADIADPGRNAGGAAGDIYSSIENLTGSDFDDVLCGNQVTNVLQGGAGNDRLFGGAGADTLRGGDGADWLDGGAWKDVLTGGSGADSFYFANIAQAGDTITDFQAGVDHIVLSGAGFGIDPHDGFSFVDGIEPISDGPTLLCDRAGGQLLWDPDGTGAQRALLLANLSVPANFSAVDILIG